MDPLSSLVRRRLCMIVALSIAMAAYAEARLPVITDAQAMKLAARFSFERTEIPSIAHSPERQVRTVQPSLRTISAWISALGAAVSVGDLDGDGLPNDMCLVDPRFDSVTVAPIPGTGNRFAPFSLEPTESRFDIRTIAPMGCLITDLNEDGLMDVLVYYWGRPPIAFLRRGGSVGHLAASEFRAVDIAGDDQRWYTNAVTRADLDGDGHADLVIGNYFPETAEILDASATSPQFMHNTMSRANNGGLKHFLLWSSGTGGRNPSVSFKEAPVEVNEDISRSWSLAVGAWDLDGDLLPELYFANDFGPDQLLYNRSVPGHLRFISVKGRRGFSVPKSFVLGEDSFKGMGVDFGDLNNNGLPDIFVSNISATWGLQESNFVWMNTGESHAPAMSVAPFFQNSEALGLSRSGWGWDVKLDDFDNEGNLEVLQATGFIRGKVNGWPALQSLATNNNAMLSHPEYWPRFEPGVDLAGSGGLAFFSRSDDGRFYNIAADVGLGGPDVTRGIAVADVDGDGRLDFVAANQWQPSFYFHNVSKNVGGFLGIHALRTLDGTDDGQVEEYPGHPVADRPGVVATGAEVTLRRDDGRVLVAQVDGGNGHSGKRSPEVHFGLAHSHAEKLPVLIRWRGVTGRPHQAALLLRPGWHTLILH